MDKNFLDKVVYQLESETKIDAVKEEIHFQFLPLDEIYGSNTFHIPYFDFLFIYNSLFKHCKEVYGLNEEESEYVWTEYENNTKFHLLTQGMYDAMIDVVYNRGCGRFINSKILSNIENGSYDSAKQMIKNLSGDKKRWNETSELFTY